MISGPAVLKEVRDYLVRTEFLFGRDVDVTERK